MAETALYTGNEVFPKDFNHGVPANDLNRVPPRPAKIRTANHVATLDDVGRFNEMDLAGANTFTIPPNSSVAFPLETIIIVQQVGAGVTTITRGVGVVLKSAGNSNADADRALSGQWAVAYLRKRGTNEWVVTGSLT